MRSLTVHAMVILLLSMQPLPGLCDDGISVFEPMRTRSHTKVIRSSQVEYSIKAGGTVDIFTGNTRSNSLMSGNLSLTYNIPDAALFFGRFSENHRSCYVRAKSFHATTAIDQDDITIL